MCPIYRVHFIHIIDTDGVFISEDCILEDNKCEYICYSENNIKYKNKQIVIDRNRKKASMINKLLSTNSIWIDIPYSLYYMSCNLDCVLSGTYSNLSDKEKEDCAYNFVQKYIDDIPGFVDFINSKKISCSEKYKDSWDFIKRDNNSLKRLSNINTFINDKLKDKN